MKPMQKGCYAVIFSNQLREQGDVFYTQLSTNLRELAKKQDGYIGLESYRNSDGSGVTISYWKTQEDVLNWKKNSEHLVAQHYGREKAYEHYRVQVCEVLRSYGYDSDS
jgi:heme-degrading monooxygenase HmoA